MILPSSKYHGLFHQLRVGGAAAGLDREDGGIPTTEPLCWFARTSHPIPCGTNTPGSALFEIDLETKSSKTLFFRSKEKLWLRGPDWVDPAKARSWDDEAGCWRVEA